MFRTERYANYATDAAYWERKRMRKEETKRVKVLPFRYTLRIIL